jgi:hypothetical protein
MTDEANTDDVEFVAYRVHGDAARTDDEDLWAAPVKRAWMEAMPERFANRCLPLLVANQSGWLLINIDTVRLTWDGGPGVDAVAVEYDEEPTGLPALSHFGAGIVTWSMPYLFRTSPGWNLLVRGPANCPKDGIYPLDGIVETDWTAATFTMNWQLTRPGLTVTFERGEPIAMFVPQRRGQLEHVRPRIRSIDADAELAEEYAAWSSSRSQFLTALADEDPAARAAGWQKHYFQGRDLAGTRQPQHQTRLKIRDFVDEGRWSESGDEKVGG